MTRRERLERKAAKRREWAEKAKKREDSRWKASSDAVKNIPLGQPILVGHHSEKGHRRAVKKSHSNAQKAIEEGQKAELHTRRADGLEKLLSRTIFSDDPDAIEALTQKIEYLENRREAMKAANAAWRKAGKVKAEGSWGDGRPYPAYSLKNLAANIRTAKKRIETIRRTKAAQAEAAKSHLGFTLSVKEADGGRRYCTLTFAEFPGREAINELKDAGFFWSRPSWCGNFDKLPERYMEAAKQG